MIRKLLPADLDSAIDIWLRASIIAHDFIPKEFWQGKIGDMKSIYLPNSESYILEDQNKIVGFVSLVENQIAAIFVDPHQQGKGYGKKLLSYTKELRTNLELSVYAKNSKSIEFYKNQNFKIQKEELEPEANEPCFVMTWSK